MILCTGVTLLSIEDMRYNFLTFVMCFLWGIEDGALNIHTYQVLGTEFKSKTEPFSVFNLIQGLAVFAFQGAQSMIDTDHKGSIVNWTLVVGAFAVLACLTTYFMPFNKIDKNSPEYRARMEIAGASSEIVSASSLQLSPVGQSDKNRDYKLNLTENTQSSMFRDSSTKE